MAQDSDIADDVIPGSLKRSRSYHGNYGTKTYKEIKDLAAAIPPDNKGPSDGKAHRADRAAPEERQRPAVVSTLRTLKQLRLSTVSRLWDEKDFDKALAEVESLLETWPGNPHLNVLQGEPDAIAGRAEIRRGRSQAGSTTGHRTGQGISNSLPSNSVTFLTTSKTTLKPPSKPMPEGIAAARTPSHRRVDRASQGI